MTHAELASYLPLPVMVPIAGAVCAPLAARIDRRLPLLISLLALAGATAVLALAAPTVFGGRILVHYLGAVRPVGVHALGIAFAADPFGLTFALVAAAVGGLLLLFTLSSLRELGARELGAYACLFQLLLAALIGSALTADLFNLFVWFEVAALSSYGLTGFFLERPIALEAAFKVLVLTTLASFMIFVGAALLYAGHGALNFGQLHLALAGGAGTADMVALGLLVCGFATKAGLVPFHGWLADAHTAAPGPVSALFSGLMVNLGIVAIARIALQVYGPAVGRPLLGLLTAGGLVSALAGALLALGQDDLKRLLAYDTVSQMGILVVGLGTGVATGVAGSTYHLVNHALFKALMFLCAGGIVHATGVTSLGEMGGLARRQPGLTAGFTVGVISIAGLPPLGGYASLGLIHEGAKSTHPVVYGLLLVAQTITIAALARAAWLAFWRPRAEPYERFDRLHPGMVVALTALGGGCLAFGVAPGWALDHLAAPAASGLLHAGTYGAGVLGGGARLAPLHLAFDYLDPAELATVGATVVAGLALAWAYLRAAAEPAPIRLLRALHTGSVNDYAGYAVIGVLAALLALAA